MLSEKGWGAGGRANYLYLGLLNRVLLNLFVFGCIWLYLVVFGCSQPGEYCQRQAGPIKGAKLGSRGALNNPTVCSSTRNVTFVKGIGEGVKLGLLSSYFEPTGPKFTANIIGQFFLSSGIPLPT